MNIDLKELMILFSESNISEMKLESEELRLYLAKAASAPQPAAKAAVEPVVPVVEEKVPTAEVYQEQLGPNTREICSPMVGTFYRAPTPDSDPFVTEGSMVEKGQTLCIIEAMKLMNELESEYNGIVVKILAENGQPVEYGQPLFLMETAE